METDVRGNWVGSSYAWASISDWGRLGQLVLQDSKWGPEAKQVLPPSWLKRASTPATAGDGQGYGATGWLYGNHQAGDCKAYPGVPEDVAAMGGHWGQMVAVWYPRAKALWSAWAGSMAPTTNVNSLSDVLLALPK